MLFIATGTKLRGRFSVIIALLVISLVGVVYPVYTKYVSIRPISDFLFSRNIYVDDTHFNKGYIYNDGSRFIYINGLDVDGYKYSDILAIDNNNIIDATYANESDDSLDLFGVSIYDTKNHTMLKEATYKIQVDSYSDNSTILDLLFATTLLPYFGSIFTFFTDIDVPIYIYLILYASLFFLLMGFYTLGGALSVNGLRFHNIIISFGIYFIFISWLHIIFSSISKDISIYNLLVGLGVLQSSLIVLFIAAFINVISFLLHYTLRFDKYYKN